MDSPYSAVKAVDRGASRASSDKEIDATRRHGHEFVDGEVGHFPGSIADGLMTEDGEFAATWVDNSFVEHSRSPRCPRARNCRVSAETRGWTLSSRCGIRSATRSSWVSRSSMGPCALRGPC